MSKFNAAVSLAPQPTIKAVGPATTYNGGEGVSRDAKSELFLLAVSNMVGEDTFYEAKSDRDKRFAELVREVAQTDSLWLLRFIKWLRNDANMRTASIVAAVEGATVLIGTDHMPRKKNGVVAPRPLTGRQLVDAALQRADEPGEALAYFLQTHGRQFPISIKKGVADAALRLFNEYSYLKYNSDARAVKIADVIELVRPKPTTAEQSALFKYVLDARHGIEEIVLELPMLKARAELYALPVELRRALVLADPAEGEVSSLKAAGMTWESLAGWLQGPMDKAAWESVIPQMGYMALLRNLRNFDEAGVSDAVAKKVGERLADPEQVAKSRQFPLRFLSALRAAPSLRWAWPLEQAVNLSLSNVPALKGKTLILVDRSGSMWDGKLSKNSTLTYADGAALFGSALALRAENATLVEFGTSSRTVTYTSGSSLLPMIEKFTSMGGTNTKAALQATYKGHDRVVILTDEQYNSWTGLHYSNDHLTVGDVIPKDVPLYTWNLAGYKAGQAGGPNRHTFGGLSDAAFKMISFLEARHWGEWPF